MSIKGLENQGVKNRVKKFAATEGVGRSLRVDIITVEVPGDENAAPDPIES